MESRILSAIKRLLEDREGEGGEDREGECVKKRCKCFVDDVDIEIDVTKILLEKNTFQGWKGSSEECIVCTNPTQTFMNCCQASCCKDCFKKWVVEKMKTSCVHCRSKIDLK